MLNNKNSFFALLPLYMVILIDVMGIVLVFPVLTPLILQSSSGLVPAGTSAGLRDFLYGFALALFPLFMFFSTPILGDLSDKFGRKSILLLCMFVSAASYLVSAVAIIYHSLFLLLFSRAIAGLAAGTQPIASAAIIDKSPTERRARNLSWVVFMGSIGLIIGPLIGGLSSEKSVFSFLGYYMPFLLSGILAVLNAIFLLFAYKDEHVPKPNQEVQLTKGFRLFLAAFKSKQFALLAFAYFGFSLAWSLYYQAITWYFMQSFNYGPGKLGLFVGFIGLVFVLATSVVAKIVLRIFSDEKRIFCFFVFLMALANIVSGCSDNELAQWLLVIINGTCNVICYALTLSLFSSLVGEESQGWIMGVAGAIGAITWTVGGLISGPLGYINIHVPMLTGGLLCFVSFVIMYFHQKMYLHAKRSNEIIMPH